MVYFHDRIIYNNGTKSDELHYNKCKYILYIVAYIIIWFLKIYYYVFICIYIVSWETKLHTTRNKQGRETKGLDKDRGKCMFLSMGGNTIWGALGCDRRN